MSIRRRCVAGWTTFSTVTGWPAFSKVASRFGIGDGAATSKGAVDLIDTESAIRGLRQRHST